MTSTIVTVTPNPSVDRALEVATLERGEVQRATRTRTDAGGKGVNVARALTAQHLPALAVLPSGGPDGALLTALLAGAGVPHHAVAVGAETRSNITLTEPDGTTTKVNAPGAPLGADDVEALLAATAEAVTTSRAAWLVGCGSLPTGAPTDFHARLVEVGHAAGVPVAVDATGTALLAAVDAGADLIKPNREELEEVLGRPLPDLAAVVDGARELRHRGVGTVVVSLGGDGAVLVDDSPPTLAVPPAVQARSTVGAGDTLLAGYLGSLVAGHSPAAALAVAVAWGAAAAALPGTQVPRPTDIQPDRVTTSALPSPPSSPAPSSPAPSSPAPSSPAA